MKNKLSLFLALGVLVFTVLGCSSINPLGGDTSSQSNKSISDKAVDVAVGESKVGIPECDEVLDQITAEMNNPDDGYVAKAFKQTVLNRIKDSIRESVANQAGKDREEMVKNCREFKTQLDKFKAEEAAKKTEAQ
ncbi:MAG: hypothetical protein QUS14_14100 [Pyrinomonadaceae bacterium]|nr:hypothetical protein [Pyrinomonadaceae bacterium]